MNNKTLSGMKWILCLCGGLLVLGSNQLYAGEPKGKVAAPTISNIGFVENPPKELKEKFPMCEAFLKVEWVDKEKKIGYSQYDFYKDGKKTRGVTAALVHLDDDYPKYEYNLELYRKEGKLKEIFALIKRGKVEFHFGADLHIVGESNGELYDYEFSDIDIDWGMTSWLSLADHKMNVCIPYPDNQRMFLAEQKEAGKIYSGSELASKLAELKKGIAHVSRFERYFVMDINHDGKEDYLSRGDILYSYGDRYYEMQFSSMRDSNTTKLISPANQKTCEFDQKLARGRYYFTTDGKNIFISNQCSLTELTR